MMNLHVEKVTSMGLNLTGHSPKEDCCSFMVSLIRPSICILRKQNSDSIIRMKISIQCYLK